MFLVAETLGGEEREMLITLRPDQEDAVEKLANGKILYGGVGSGKSVTAATYYMRNEAPKDIYVITTARKRESLDWSTEFARLGVGRTPDATIAGVLTVDSWQNIGKYTNIHGAFFIFDEQRLVGSGGWSKAFLHIAKSNNWILLSATPGDTWLDYIPVFIANGFYRTRTEFKNRHVEYDQYVTKYPKIKGYKDTSHLLKLRDQILVTMAYGAHTERIEEEIAVDYDRDKYVELLKRRWNPFTDEPIKNVSELFMAMRRVVNSHPSRMHAMRSLIKIHPRMIVFYNFDFELELLRELADEITVAEWNGHKHEEVPETESWVYLVQYVAGAEAWNCITTDTTVFYSLNYSWKIMEQAKGRIDRANTSYRELFYYSLISYSSIDRAITKALSMKLSFNERTFLRYLRD